MGESTVSSKSGNSHQRRKVLSVVSDELGKTVTLSQNMSQVKDLNVADSSIRTNHVRPKNKVTISSHI